MAADDLATQGARASAAMVFTMLNRINSVPVHKRLTVVKFQEQIKLPGSALETNLIEL